MIISLILLFLLMYFILTHFHSFIHSFFICPYLPIRCLQPAESKPHHQAQHPTKQVTAQHPEPSGPTVLNKHKRIEWVNSIRKSEFNLSVSHRDLRKCAKLNIFTIYLQISIKFRNFMASGIK